MREGGRGGRLCYDRPRTDSTILLPPRPPEIPLYILSALLVCHALSGTSSLSLAHLSNRLPSSIQKLLPAWAWRLPNLAPFASDVPNASHNSKLHPSGNWNGFVGQAGPFRSDAAGFGHPLTALHTFTRACLGLSYAVSANESSISERLVAATYGSTIPEREPWAWLVGQPGAVYAKGFKDAFYVCTWILIWTALRAATIRYALVPLGARWVTKPKFTEDQKKGGSKRLRKIKCWEKNIMRFAEQSWCVLFYVTYWSLGLHIAYNSPYWFNTAGFWEGHPHTELQGIVKFYYLTQCGFWFHMLIVINVEARRKDHWQMFSHHIITILLIVGSYLAHFTRVGNAVLCLMDPSDILLSAAKCLRYVGLQTLCDAAFGAFMFSWMITRHALYMALVYACFQIVTRKGYDQARTPEYAWRWRASWPFLSSPATPSSSAASAAQLAMPSSLDAGSAGAAGALASQALPPPSLSDYLFDAIPSHFTLVALLVVLQFILLIWFGMIVRVAYRVVTGAGAADTRSDEELSEEDERAIAAAEEREERQANKATAAAAAAGTAATTRTGVEEYSGGGALKARPGAGRRAASGNGTGKQAAVTSTSTPSQV